MDSLERLKKIRLDKLKGLEVKQSHAEILESDVKTRETLVNLFDMLIDFLENNVSRTQVVNQLEAIRTPDVANVVKSVEDLHGTLKTHKNTDLTEVTKVMKSVLEQVKAIPKELPKQEKENPIDYTKTLKDLEKAMKSVEKQVKAQKLVAEAPVVNVPEAVVNVEKPDLKPLNNRLDKVVKAVEKNKPLKSVSTVQTNMFVNEEFDEWRLVYDNFELDEDKPRIEAIVYYNKGKKVAKVKLSYTEDGQISGGKKAKV